MIEFRSHEGDRCTTSNAGLSLTDAAYVAFSLVGSGVCVWPITRISVDHINPTPI